jgi:hypothetical protein
MNLVLWADQFCLKRGATYFCGWISGGLVVNILTRNWQCPWTQRNDCYYYQYGEGNDRSCRYNDNQLSEDGSEINSRNITYVYFYFFIISLLRSLVQAALCRMAGWKNLGARGRGIIWGKVAFYLQELRERNHDQYSRFLVEGPAEYQEGLCCPLHRDAGTKLLIIGKGKVVPVLN